MRRWIFAFGRALRQEWRATLQSRWNIAQLLLIPLLTLLLLGSMFFYGKANHTPVAVVDEDNSPLSRAIVYRLNASEAVSVMPTQNVAHAQDAINRLRVYAYLRIPSGAQERLLRGDDPSLSVAYNQAFFSAGAAASSALVNHTQAAAAHFVREDFLKNSVPSLHLHAPAVKTSILFNPDLSYEFFLAPLIAPAVLHLLLSCLVAFAVGGACANQTAKTRLGSAPFAALLGKISLYVAAIFVFNLIWIAWLAYGRGWFVGGSMGALLLGLFLLYWAYALFGSGVALATKSASKSFGFLAVYGGSSLSFAGVSLPLNNAVDFAQFWSKIIPYTHYAHLQTRVWAQGSSFAGVGDALWALAVFTLLFAGLNAFLIAKAAYD